MRCRHFCALVCAALCVTTLFFASRALASGASALPYLEAHAQSPWVVMALSSLGKIADTTFLQSATSTTAIGLEAPILALTAAHQDPSTYPASDLVQGLESFYTQGQIGDPATLNDDIFGVLALISAGISPQNSVIVGTKVFIEAHQNQDGGWPFMVGDASDTNTTAAAIMALIASGSSQGDTGIVQALAYLHAAQNQDGGFPYDPKSQWGTASDASSDAWAMLALSASGVSESSWAAASGTPMTDLLTYQVSDGYFEFQHGSGEDAFTPVTTSYAVLALSGKTLPVAILPPLLPPQSIQPVTPSNTGGGGGGGGAISGPLSFGFTASATTAQVQNPASPLGVVLGTSTTFIESTTPLATATTTSKNSFYPFTYNLRYGLKDNAVFELQKKLIAHSILSIIVPTGWFGPLTLKAVKIFQEQNEIPATGFVGAMTRGSLNAWK